MRRIGISSGPSTRVPLAERRPARGAAGAAAGVLAALSLPPWGWWPLAFVGTGWLAALASDRSWRGRLLAGEAFGVGYFAVSLFWMHDFTLPGYVAAFLLHATFVGAALLVTPVAGAGALAVVPAALVLAEAGRSHWPFGGVPVSGIDLGQAGGPLAPAAALGGRLLVVGLVGVAGVALWRVVVGARSRAHAGALVAVAVVLLVAAPVAGMLAQGGRDAGSLDVAAVQGGGHRGVRAVDSDPAEVFAAHLRASANVERGRDLVLWPEDVVDVTRLSGSPEAEALARLARRLRATLVVGATEDVGRDRFSNFAVALSPTGEVVDRFDKVQRVPFGEYIPFRGLVEEVADVSAVPRDAVGGEGPGVLDTPAGWLGVVISYEVFFSGRGRAAIGAGGRVLLVPTNASSYRTSQMPGHELAAARLRAWETGRWVVQAAPTGYSAVIDRRGRVRAKSDLGVPAVLAVDDVRLRAGRTPYGRVGDVPVLALAGALVVVAAVRGRRHRAPTPA